MTVIEFYTSIGVEFSDVKRRLGSEKIAQKFLKRIPDDPTYGMLKEAVAKKDKEEIFRGAHTLKGVALNLSVEPLAEAASDMTEMVRGDHTDVEGAIKKFAEVTAIYEDVVAKIAEID